jgi:hypothetical protein
VDRVLIATIVLAAVGVLALVLRRRAARPTALPARVDPRHVGLDARGVIAFSGPLCHACQEWNAELDAAGIPFRKIDVLQEAGLARAYGITHTPVVLVVDRDGRVLEGYDDAPDADSVDRVRELALA